MKTLTLTEQEFEFVKMAVSVQNDMMQDTLLDNVSTNLYPSKDDEPTILTPVKANQLREELEEVFQNIRMLDRLTTKFGIKIRDNGFSA